MLNKRPGSVVETIWEGLHPDERLIQGRSPLAYLSLNELKDFCSKAWREASRRAACLPARSDEGARTDSQPARFEAPKNHEFSALQHGGFSDLRRCSTADQSGLPDLQDFPDGN